MDVPVFECRLGLAHEDQLEGGNEGDESSTQKNQGNDEAENACHLVARLTEETTLCKLALRDLLVVVFLSVHVALVLFTWARLLIQDVVVTFDQLLVAALANFLKVLVQARVDAIVRLTDEILQG